MSVNTPARVAIIGLGRIGSRFDEEPNRKTIWSHAGAYLARPYLFKLAAACDVDADNASKFAARCPDVPVVGDVKEMLELAKPSVVSICTPADIHAQNLDQVLQCETVRAVWCEKPLATTPRDGAAMIEAARNRGVNLVISYVRRWTPIWMKASEIVRSGALGTVRVVRIAIPNRLWSMGSHAVDLIEYIGGPIAEVQPFSIPELNEEGELAAAAFFRYVNGGYGIFQVTGWKANYIVEGEIIGDAGRLTICENQGTITLEHFETSQRYAGYRELGSPNIEQINVPEDFSPFVAIVDEIGELLAGARRRPTSDGQTALAVQSALARMHEVTSRASRRAR